MVDLVNHLEITDDAMQLFDFLMTMMLEDVMYTNNGLLKARMHVKTWRQNITEGGEVTIEVTEDPFYPRTQKQVCRYGQGLCGKSTNDRPSEQD